AVMGLEAIAQAAMALAERNSPPVFDDVEFNRAIIIPLEGTTRISIAALIREDGAVEVVVRSQDTDYQVIHFRAVCRFDTVHPLPERQSSLTHPGLMTQEKTEISGLVPERDLYGNLLFHKGRFVRVIRYYKVTATECIADVGESNSAWFGSYLPRALVLGCPARRDGVIHAIQACVPDASLLPVGAGRLQIYDGSHSGPCRLIARERDRGPGLFVYDVCVVAEDGSLLESWEGLKLRRVSANPLPGGWPLPLLVPYIERCVTDAVAGSQVSIALDCANGDRRSRSEGVISLALSD